MRKNLPLLALSLLSMSLYSQKVTIQWDGSKVFDNGISAKTLPFFKNNGYNTDSNGVILNVSKKNDGKELIVKNIIWEKANVTELFDLNRSLLPQENDYGITYFFNEKENAEFGNLRISTFKIVNNQIYRLVSFDLEQSNKALIVGKSPLYGTTENPLKSGTFFKIKVDKSGIFKITKKFLQDNGINVNSINPKNFRIYGNGGLMLPEYNKDGRFSALQENSIQVIGEEDGVWNDNDYAIFYAQGPNGYNLYPSAQSSRSSRTETRTDKSKNIVNLYEDYSYYFINFDIGEGLRINTDETALPSSNPISRYDDYQYINEEKFNLMRLGRIWVGDTFNSEKTVTFNTRTPIKPEDKISYRTRVITFNAEGNTLAFNINGKNPVAYTAPKDYAFMLFENDITGLSGNSLNFQYNPTISSNPNGQFYWDYAEITYKQDLTFNSSQMNFRSYDIAENSNNLYRFSMTNTNGLEQIWDVSNYTKPVNKKNKSTGASFDFAYQASSPIFNNEFVAFNSTSAYSPTFVGRIENQDLSALSNVDYLIITQTNMLGEAQRLANYYNNKFNVQVVDVNKIYNEFSSGSKDITAIRDFVTRLKTVTGNLKYVLLLGDTSYDFKNRIANNSDIIPSYQSENSQDYSASYVTDDYFVMTSPQSDSQIYNNLPTIPIGRLPAANISEAKLLIDKTLAYYNALPSQSNNSSNPFGEWRMKLDFVVDDDSDNPSGANPVAFHNTMNDALVNVFEKGQRSEYNVRKLYLDAFPAESSAGGQRYPQVNQAISNDVGNSLYLFYFGHGGINGWAQERVLTSTEVQNFNNYNNIFAKFPLVSTITCEFTLWDEPNTNSVGEQIIKLKTGGAATMITSSRAIGIAYGIDMTKYFTQRIFSLTDDGFEPLGDAFLKARKDHGFKSDHLKVNFLGDPAMTLSRPKRLIKIDEVPDQIKALDFVKIKGHITKADGSIDESFNGRVVINIFDKKIEKKTLNNDNSNEMKNILQYQEEGSPIVKASGTAIKGVFTVEFYVPKDINYKVGEGRILAYADNKNFDVFANQIQKVGDINPNGINDSEPPKVQLYMNNTNFADGGITNQNPNLLACVTDNIGINSTGAGIGHDITVLLDGEVINTKVLNDFFSAGESNGCLNPSLADYQKGSVTYPFRDLKPGEHQLTFKVWDINNNSTSSTLNFVVKDESQQQLVINRPLNWPNPFTNKTYVQFEHNCDDILDVNVQIFTITGKLVRTLTNSITAEPFLEGYRTPKQAIEWDGKDDFGDTVAKGTYIFKIFAKSQNQDKCKGSATAVEKMVLLK